MAKINYLTKAMGHQFEDSLLCKYCEYGWWDQKDEPVICEIGTKVLEENKRNQRKRREERKRKKEEREREEKEKEETGLEASQTSSPKEMHTPPPTEHHDRRTPES